MLQILLFALPGLLLGYGIYELVDDSSSDNGDETITGNDQANNIDGKNGNDLIAGLGGNDNIEGGSGNDTIGGGTGDDVVVGELDNDVIIGGEGDDLLQGGQGADSVSGDAGEDWVEGDAGNDTLDGGADSDLVFGGRGSDQVSGGEGDDLLFGGKIAGTPLSLTEMVSLRDGEPLADILNSSTNNAALFRDDNEADTLNGGAGDDLLIVGAGDTAIGGEGEDMFSLLADQVGTDALTGDPLFGDPALISDFTDEDSLVVITYNATSPVIDVTVDGDDALVTANGEFLARVTGAGATLNASDISIMPAPRVGDLDPNL